MSLDCHPLSPILDPAYCKKHRLAPLVETYPVARYAPIRLPMPKYAKAQPGIIRRKKAA